MLHEGSPHWSGHTNLHTIKSYGQPLGVTSTCGRKLAIPLRPCSQTKRKSRSSWLWTCFRDTDD